jgi:hypothetical protein
MKRVFLEEHEEPYLVYQSPMQYQRDMQQFVLPSDAATLLKHARGLHEFLDDLADAVDSTIPQTAPPVERTADPFAFLDQADDD